MDLKWLEDFIALARAGSFSKAASQRFVTQPAFSRRIRSLEEWIGTELFDRGISPVELTGAGKQLLPHALSIISEAESVRQDFRLLFGSDKSSIRIMTSHRLSINMVPRMVAQFLRENPGIGISVMPKVESTEKYGDYTDALITGLADFLITYEHESLIEDANLSDSLECRKLAKDQIVPVTSPAYAQSIGNKWYEDESKKITYVGYPEYSFTERIIRPIIQKHEKKLKKVYESPFTGSIRALLLEGIGMTWLPLSVVADDLKSGKLVCLEADGMTVDIRVIIYRRKESTGPVMEKFWTYISEHHAQS